MSKKRTKKLTVGVIFGGRSGEHEVSLVSAASVIKNIPRSKYTVVPIGITKEGLWIIDSPMNQLKSGRVTEKGTRLLPESVVKKCDVFFPVLHGPYGEDGTVQGMLEMAGAAYVGAGVLSSAICMDKVIQKQVCDEAGIPQVRYDWFYGKDWKRSPGLIIRKLEKNLRYPMFIKPANLGSSVAISRASNKKELVTAINLAFKYDRKIIVEQGMVNFYEIECAVIGNDKPKASWPGEIISSNDFYDYDAKYVDGLTDEVAKTTNLSVKVVKEIKSMAVKTYQVMNCKGLARVDFMVGKKTSQIKLTEINTMPGFTSISMYPKMWASTGLKYPKMLDKLIGLAVLEKVQKDRLQTSFKPKRAWYQE